MNDERYFLNLCFLDGKRDGAVRCQDGEEKYIAYRFSKERYEGIRREKRSDDLLAHVENKGIYFLLFRRENGFVDRVYVGKAGDRSNERLGMLNRINEHRRDSYRDWSEAVLLTTKDNAWGPTELNYLENGFYKILNENGTHACGNGNTPTGATPTDQRKHYLDRFMAKLSRDLVSAMGLNFLNPPKKIIRKLQRKASRACGSIEPTCQNASGRNCQNVGTKAVSPKLSSEATPRTTAKQPNFAFAVVGVPVGATLEFTETPLKVTVVDEKNKVEYKGHPYSLSGFVKAFHPRPNSSGSYQGPKFFTYNGQRLIDLRNAGAASSTPCGNTCPVSISLPGRKILRCASRGSDATGYATDDGFVVIKGSRLSLQTTTSFKTCKQEVKMREMLLKDGSILGDRLTRDVICPSISSAAKFVMGTSANGKKEWK